LGGLMGEEPGCKTCCVWLHQKNLGLMC
jgi:hypothetical protein